MLPVGSIDLCDTTKPRAPNRGSCGVAPEAAGNGPLKFNGGPLSSWVHSQSVRAFTERNHECSRNTAWPQMYERVLLNHRKILEITTKEKVDTYIFQFKLFMNIFRLPGYRIFSSNAYVIWHKSDSSWICCIHEGPLFTGPTNAAVISHSRAPYRLFPGCFEQTSYGHSRSRYRAIRILPSPYGARRVLRHAL